MKSILEVEGVCKHYEKQDVLRGISFNVNPGEIVGLLGPNGVGKSTLFKIISGLQSKDSGKVLLDGISYEKDRLKYLSKIGILIEQPALYMKLNAYKNMEQQARLYGAVDKDRINELLQVFELDNTKNKKVKFFSLGMKQRLGIAMALYSKPLLILLDEPMNGLDPEGIIKMRSILKKIVEKNVSIIISSHILQEIEMLSDRILILDDGIIKEQLINDKKNRVTSDLENTYMQAVKKRN